MSLSSNPSVVQVTIENDNEATDFLSHIRREVLPIRLYCLDDCSERPGCPTCENDTHWRQIVRLDDVLYLQFNLPDDYNEKPEEPDFGWSHDDSAHWLELDVFNGDGTLAMEDITNVNTDPSVVIGHAVGNNDGLNFQNANIDVEALRSQLNSDCFYFRVKLCRREYPEPDYLAPFVFTAQFPNAGAFATGDYILVNEELYINQNFAWVLVDLNGGDTVYSSANGQWYSYVNGKLRIFVQDYGNDCDEFVSCYTDMYKVRLCQNVVCFDSLPSVKDCFGRYFGRVASVFRGNYQHRNKFCLVGSFENECYEPVITRTDGGAVIRRELIEKRRLRLSGIPGRIAKKLSATFMHDNLTVDGLEWDDVGEICKNNDESDMWYVNSLLSATDCVVTEENCD